MNGVKSVMKNAADSKRFEAKVAKNGKFHFNLKAGNGQVNWQKRNVRVRVEL